MATAMANQRASVEGKVRLLVNADLKEICKAHGLQVSGTKVVLQRRCLEALESLIRKNDVVGFENFKARVNNHGKLPTAPPPPAPSSSHNHHNSYNMGGLGSFPARKARHFKPSPFYEIIDTVLETQDLPEMPQNRNTVKANIILSDDFVRRLKADSSLRILMYCGQSSQLAGISNADVAFPNQIEVKINGDEVKHNFKGLKNKPGTTKPADITSLIRLAVGYPSQITLTYALTNRRFAYNAYLARYISPDELVKKIQNAQVIPKHTVIAEMNKASADDDIAATTVLMSLKDPISTMRIDLPVRSTICKHIQCFDCAMFLQMQEQAPRWLCPICDKPIPFSTLCVDKYFEEILLGTPKAIEKVKVEPNGEWTMIKEEDESQPNGHSSKPRASYDDDFDDLIEITDDSSPPPRPTNNGVRLSAAHKLAMNTPPASSREPSLAKSSTSAQPQGQKRPASAVVIDLISDDEDEPPRPAKRPAPSNHPSGATSFPTSGSSTAPYTNSRGQTNGYHRPPSFGSTSQHSASQSPVATNHNSNAFQRGPGRMSLMPPRPSSTTQAGNPSYSSYASAPSPFANVGQSSNTLPNSTSSFGQPPPPNGIRLPPLQSTAAFQNGWARYSNSPPQP